MVSTASTASTDSRPIDLRLLGPLTVTADGTDVPTGGPRQMAVLARLMLTPGQVVSMDQLVDSVWDGDEPAQPNVAIRSYVSNLRRAIEPNRRRRAADSCLASAPPGYMLAIDPSSVDWIRFERLVEEGRMRVSSGDYGAAIDKFRRADSLWRGDPCAGLPDSQIFLSHRGRMTKLRETAVELLFEALLHRGDHALVVNEIEAAIAEHPLRERLTELAMAAFYQAGRQSEALGLGQQLRARLLEDLGIDPSPAIEAMELKILNHDRSLDPVRQESTGSAVVATSPFRPTSAQTPAVIDLGALDRDHAPEPILAIGDSLRPVGRDQELAALDRMAPTLRTGRSVTAIVTGEQGIGKTTLAAAAASSLADNDIVVAWSRTMPGTSAPLWPWAQIVLSLLEQPGEIADIATSTDLGPLVALGPSVAAAVAATAPAGRPPAAPTARLPIAPGNTDQTAAQPAGLDQQTIAPVSVASESCEANADYPLQPLARPSQGAENVAEVALAITRLLERAARVTPVALVFEDLQWADEASVAVLNHATRTLVESPVGFVLTWRSQDLAGDPSVSGLRELAGLPRLMRFELDGLDGPAVAELASVGGRSLTGNESAMIEQRCGGNPLFIREVLANPDFGALEGSTWSTLIDAVLDRVQRIHPDATALLSSAALFRTPFTIEALLSVSACDRAGAKAVIDRSIRGDILIDADPAEGSYQFRHPVVAEVLAAGMLASDRAVEHRGAGHHLLSSTGAGLEVSYHLSRSPAAEDRLLSARLALDTARTDFDSTRIAEIDGFVTIGAVAAQGLTATSKPGTHGDEFAADAAAYRSWRAWVDGNQEEWLDHGRSAMLRAMAVHGECVAGRSSTRQKAPLKSTGRGSSPDPLDLTRSIDRLSRCALNLIGLPQHPVGPATTDGFPPLSPAVVDDLAAVAENLGGDHVTRWAVQLQLGFLEALAKPGGGSQTKALREAQKQASNARRRLSQADADLISRLMVSRYSDFMEPAARLKALSDMSSGGGLSAQLFIARHAYPTLLELGKTSDAEHQVERAQHAAAAGGDAIQLAEARLLWVRHLLWTGQLEYASEDIDRAVADWSKLGLVEPLAFIRQRRALRLLRGLPAVVGPAEEALGQPQRVRPLGSVQALRMARIGDEDRAKQCLETMMDTIAVRPVSLTDQALTAMAAARLKHEQASLTLYELLVGAGDQPIVRDDGSVIFGPASLYAGLAASAAGLTDAATTSLAAARKSLKRLGGSPAAFNAVVKEIGQDPKN